MILNRLCSSFFQITSDSHDVPCQRRGPGIMTASSILLSLIIHSWLASHPVLNCLNHRNPTSILKLLICQVTYYKTERLLHKTTLPGYPFSFSPGTHREKWAVKFEWEFDKSRSCLTKWHDGWGGLTASL